MISYYRNPKTEDLIILEPEEDEILIVERIKKVRVFTKGNMYMGDLREKPDFLEVEEKEKKPSKKKRRNKEMSPEVIAEVKRLKSEGKSNKDIIEETGLCLTSIYKCLRSKD